MSFKGAPVFALIPARGGSKGVPRKNLRLLAGKPLLEHTTIAALGSEFVDKVYLSSEDGEILDLAIKLGVTPIQRPQELSADTSTATDVIKHFISQLPAENLTKQAYLIYLQPTSPLRQSCHIDAAFRLMLAQNASALISVVSFEKSPYKAFKVDLDGNLLALHEEKMTNMNRQSLPQCFMPNGAMYIFTIHDFLEHRKIPSNGSKPYVMTASESIDIDSENDFAAAEAVLRGD